MPNSSANNGGGKVGPPFFLALSEVFLTSISTRHLPEPGGQNDWIYPQQGGGGRRATSLIFIWKIGYRYIRHLHIILIFIAIFPQTVFIKIVVVDRLSIVGGFSSEVVGFSSGVTLQLHKLEIQV